MYVYRIQNQDDYFDVEYSSRIFYVNIIGMQNLKVGSIIYCTGGGSDLLCLAEKIDYYHHLFEEIKDSDEFFTLCTNKSKIKTYTTKSIEEDSYLINDNIVKKGSAEFPNGVHVSVFNNVVSISNKIPIFRNDVSSFDVILACMTISTEIKKITQGITKKEDNSTLYYYNDSEIILYSCINWLTTNYDNVDFTKPVYLILSKNPYLDNIKPKNGKLATRYKAHEIMETLDTFESLSLTVTNDIIY